MRVIISSKATTMKFIAKMAGINCIFANHDNQWCNVPVKSRNINVIKMKKTPPSIILIFRNIIKILYLYYQKANALSKRSTRIIAKWE